MGDSDDFYVILDVARDASTDQIKKAYKKAALRWHPDKNPEDKEHAETMFKYVAEAYDILSDPQKRSLYDRGGKEALQAGGGIARYQAGFGRGGVDAFTVFEKFFGGRDPFAEFDEIFAQLDHRRPRNPMASMFEDEIFSDRLGGGRRFGSSSSSIRIGGLGGGVSTSIMTTTKIVNGQRVQVTQKTVRRADGTVETTKLVNGQLVDQDGTQATSRLRDPSTPVRSPQTSTHQEAAAKDPAEEVEEDAAEEASEHRTSSGIMRFFSCARCFRPKYLPQPS